MPIDSAYTGPPPDDPYRCAHCEKSLEEVERFFECERCGKVCAGCWRSHLRWHREDESTNEPVGQANGSIGV